MGSSGDSLPIRFEILTELVRNLIRSDSKGYREMNFLLKVELNKTLALPFQTLKWSSFNDAAPYHILRDNF